MKPYIAVIQRMDFNTGRITWVPIWSSKGSRATCRVETEKWRSLQEDPVLMIRLEGEFDPIKSH